jgi:hypothetical protein
MMNSAVASPGARRGLLGVVLVVGWILTAGLAQAGTILPGQYRLLDHPDGNISPPPYGLRVDALGLTFSTELGGANVILDWGGGATASIIGTMFSSSGDIWDVNYLLSGITAAPLNLGFSAAVGFGTLTDPLSNVTVLTGDTNGSGSVFDFLADGHRLGAHPAFGDADSPVGRGWLLPAGSTDDWLVRAVPIPEPGTALLLGLGLAVLSRRVRKD